MKWVLHVLVSLCWLIASACAHDAEHEVLFEPPANFGVLAYNLADNPLSLQGFELGRQLFYDPILSVDSSISCASCHQPFAAFANRGHTVSHGVRAQLGARNAPALQNLAWHRSFMLDGGVVNLEMQPIAAITNPIEMGHTLSGAVAALYRNPRYRLAFHDFGIDTINSMGMLKALAQFMVCLVSKSSAYDRFIAGDQAALSAEAKLGLQVFSREGCDGCHRPPLFRSDDFSSNGLELDPTDIGRAFITLQDHDRGRYAIPSLRNVAKTGPYMHSGSLSTLAQCIAHYRTGIVASANLDVRLKKSDGTPRTMQITDAHAQALEAFLISLTDENFCQDPRFSDPSR